MFDVALSSAGAQVVIATSSDERYPAENIIDGDEKTFWTTTGMFPQEFIVSFTSQVNMSRIELACYNVKNVKFEKSTENEPSNFETISEKELMATEGQLQQESITVNNVKAHHLKVLIESGHDHFLSINRLTVEGNAVHG